MDEYQEKTERVEQEPPRRLVGGLVAAAVIAVIAACFAIGYGYHQQSLVSQLTAQQTQMTATVGQLQGQVDSLTGKLNDVTTAQQQAATAAAEAAAKANSPAAKQAASQRSAAASKRMKEFQTRLEDQQKALKDTQDEVAKNRSDLEGNINSTRDDLNGSIARTHEELVALQKRGERNYIEFNLTKSKQFQREGPLMLSLRKADTKHKSFDLTMIVDDNELRKKNVNLYEPIWIHRSDDPQPVQVVINKIDKDRIQGYVSAPKYRNSELSPAVTPAAQKTPADSPTANPTPDNPEPLQP
jgi:hypothetical protein